MTGDLAFHDGIIPFQCILFEHIYLKTIQNHCKKIITDISFHIQKYMSWNLKKKVIFTLFYNIFNLSEWCLCFSKICS